MPVATTAGPGHSLNTMPLTVMFDAAPSVTPQWRTASFSGFHTVTPLAVTDERSNVSVNQ